MEENNVFNRNYFQLNSEAKTGWCVCAISATQNVTKMKSRVCRDWNSQLGSVCK